MYFNNYAKLDICSKPIFDSYRNEEWIAESGFTSIFMWESFHNARYCIINDILCIFCQSEYAPPYAIMLSKEFSAESVESAIEALLTIFSERNLRLILGYILPSLMPFIESLNNYNYSISYNRKNSDYIYETQDFVSLEGVKHKSRRYDINHLLRNHNAEAELMTSENSHLCLDFIAETTCLQKDCAECASDFGCEKDALNILIDNYDALGCCGMYIRLDGRLSAYVIGEKLSQNLFSYHFLKSYKSVRGLSAFIHAEFCKQFFSDVKYINYSEDMSHTGLKKYKLQMKPYKIAHKYFAEITPLIY